MESSNLNDYGEPVIDRPSMPEGYGLGSPGVTFTPLPWSWAVERLTAARNYWIATTRSDGQPHVSPVWGLWQDNRFMFSTDSSSTKAKNLRRNPSMVMHLESGDEVVVLNGHAVVARNPSRLNAFADEYYRKYEIRPETGPTAAPVFELQTETALGWLERDFPSTATRWTFG